MIQEYEVKETIKMRKRICDVCKTEIERGLACSVAKCEICGKDLCDKCVGHEKDTTGDYRECYCLTCWTIGKQYRDKIEQYEQAAENTYEEWVAGGIKARQDAEQ